MANRLRSVNAIGPQCSACKKHLPTTKYDRDSTTRLGFSSKCRPCKKKASAAYRRDPRKLAAQRLKRKTDPACVARDKKARHDWINTTEGTAYIMWLSARVRSQKKKIPFTIKPADVRIPSTCPLLGIAIVRGVGKMHAASPSLDRRDPRLGYTPGNVWVISYRANAIKQDASIEELETLITNLRQ